MFLIPRYKVRSLMYMKNQFISNYYTINEVIEIFLTNTFLPMITTLHCYLNFILYTEHYCL